MVMRTLEIIRAISLHTKHNFSMCINTNNNSTYELVALLQLIRIHHLDHAK